MISFLIIYAKKPPAQLAAFSFMPRAGKFPLAPHDVI